MCELLGFSAAEKTDIREYLRSFYSHSDLHPHGWGMMYEDGLRCVVKESVKANESILLPEIINNMPDQKCTLAHIRYATVGRIKEENCHPFTAEDNSGREWTMIHNGTIYSGGTTYRYYQKQQGDTDSERLFLAFIDNMNDRLSHKDMNERERFAAVSSFIAQHAPRNKLNLILYDGDLLYVHKNLKNTLSYKKTDRGIIFSTHPLDNTGWAPFPMAQTIAYNKGTEVYRGERHKGVFVPSLEYITSLDAMNI